MRLVLVAALLAEAAYPLLQTLAQTSATLDIVVLGVCKLHVDVSAFTTSDVNWVASIQTAVALRPVKVVVETATLAHLNAVVADLMGPQSLV